MPLPTIGLEVLSESECRALLGSSTLGRVIVSIDALPAAFPVNFGLLGDAIVFRTGPGTKLMAALNHRIVGFEVDHVDPTTCAGWSVLAVGLSSVVRDEAEIAAIETLAIRSLAGEELPHYVRITIDQISGRAIPGSLA